MSARVDLPQLVYDCFICEINALKPGNVSRYGAGHGMEYEDFVKSAERATPILCNRELSLGNRILRSVEATFDAVNCNTNLGMLLLMAPIIKVFEQGNSPGNFRDSVKSILTSLDESEANDIFAAIRLAKPAGLGKVAKYDVNAIMDTGGIDVYSAMVAAKERDLIALQYANGYREVVDIGVKCLRVYDNRWNSVEWAGVVCYLTYMANFPDSHIRRKYGNAIAEQIQRKTVPVLKLFDKYNNPDSAVDMLLEFDKELKDSGINPGACADLTAASLLLYQLGVR